MTKFCRYIYQTMMRQGLLRVSHCAFSQRPSYDYRRPTVAYLSRIRWAAQLWCLSVGVSNAVSWSTVSTLQWLPDRPNTRTSVGYSPDIRVLQDSAMVKVVMWSRGGGSLDEARLEQTPHPFHTQLIWRYLGIKSGLKVGPGRQGRRPGTLWFAGSITGLLFTLL